jgi:hypothetical protein
LPLTRFYLESIMSAIRSTRFFTSTRIAASGSWAGAALAIAAVLATALATPDVQARERQAQFKGTQGQTAVRKVQRDRGDVSSSTTGPRGQSSGREVDRSAEDTHATVTGPQGRTRNRDTELQGGGDTATTVTRPNGQTTTRETQREVVRSGTGQP